MARASRAVADRHRTAIEAASARLFREYGLHGVSVAQVMADAGLTHGGFYGHFPSKDALAAAACKRAFEESDLRWRQRIAAAGDDHQAARRSLVEPYLSPAHRDHAGLGCPASALAGDVAREPADKPVRRAYLEGLKALIETWQSTAPGIDRQAALMDLATLVGAITLARATTGDPLSDDILDAARAGMLDASTERVTA